MRQLWHEELLPLPVQSLVSAFPYPSATAAPFLENPPGVSPEGREGQYYPSRLL